MNNKDKKFSRYVCASGQTGRGARLEILSRDRARALSFLPVLSGRSTLVCAMLCAMLTHYGGRSIEKEKRWMYVCVCVCKRVHTVFIYLFIVGNPSRFDFFSLRVPHGETRGEGTRALRLPLACLILQSLGGDHKVKQGDLNTDLRQVVRVPELGGDVEPEVLAVLHRGVAQPDAVAAALLEDLLEQQRLQRRVQLLADVFQQYRLSELRSPIQVGGGSCGG